MLLVNVCYLRITVYVLECFCFREYEEDSSTVLEQFFEKDQRKTFELIARKLSRWEKIVDGNDFVVIVRNNCCQAYLDKTWIGRTSVCDWAYMKVTDQLTL